jgi:phosphoribosylanthranilate isomerase
VTRIKCCGMTRVADALLATQLGADAIGLVFTARSPRQVTIAQGQLIVQALPPFVASVALFMDDDARWVRQVVHEVQPTLLQFHGGEVDAWCMQFGRPFLKAIAMGDGAAGLAGLRAYPHAAALLLDGHARGAAGGSGHAFDWSLLPAGLSQPMILAGGLDAQNVGAGIRAVHPWAVDVSSGVESAPGIKAADKLAAFIHAVRAADAT